MHDTALMLATLLLFASGVFGVWAGEKLAGLFVE